MSGFSLIAVSILVGTAIVCGSRCCSNRSLKEQQFRDQYRQVERTVFKEEAEKFIKKHAEQDAQTFFVKIGEQFSANTLDSFHKTWADISKLGEYTDDIHFSRLQIYAISQEQQQQPSPQQPSSPQLPLSTTTIST
ncbi:unnamed protein product [Lampetra planeri]